MKKTLLFCLISIAALGQSVTISPSNNNTPMINATGTNSGILVPRMTASQKQAISNPATGMLIYQTDSPVGFYVQKSTLLNIPNWRIISEGRNFLDNSLVDVNDIYNTNTGKFGIGTSNPADKLTVQTGNGYGITHTNGTTALSTYIDATAGWLGTKSNHPLYFYTNGSGGQMTLNTNGRVGIGVGGNPDQLLDVNGRMRIRHNVNTSGLWMSNSTNSLSDADGAFYGMKNDTEAGIYIGNNWRFWVNNAGNAAITGRLGIGIASPNAPLQFETSLSNRKIVMFELANNDHQFVGFGVNGNTLRYQVDYPSANHVFYAGASTSTSTELMRIQGNGNVGIGTNAPNYKLQVNTTGNGAGIVHANNAGIQIGTYTGFGGGWLGTISNHPLNFFVNNGNPSVSITTAGQFQVGSTSIPTGYKMSVDGKLIATEIDVLITPWPDYVFKPSYKLKPLPEVEKYIAENGHLPNIPKAEEIENKALSIGNMSKLQMEKIEELTLYLIEVNKRLERVETENIALKKELNIIKIQN